MGGRGQILASQGLVSSRAVKHLPQSGTKMTIIRANADFAITGQRYLLYLNVKQGGGEQGQAKIKLGLL